MRSITLCLLISVASLSGCEWYVLDQKMEALCSKDGGVVVNERVKLSAKHYHSGGEVMTGPVTMIGTGKSLKEVAGEFEIVLTIETIKAGNPFSGFISEGRLQRYVTQVIRKSDSKVLGTQITYGRTGGSITLGHPSQAHCPNPRPAPGVTNSVFIKEE